MQGKRSLCSPIGIPGKRVRAREWDPATLHLIERRLEGSDRVGGQVLVHLSNVLLLNGFDADRLIGSMLSAHAGTCQLNKQEEEGQEGEDDGESGQDGRVGLFSSAPAVNYQVYTISRI